MSNKKLFLIDGMALIYRSYYAMAKNPLISSKGLNTSAIYGFINSMMKLINDEKPHYLAVVLDTKAKTFRHKEFDLYKANRKPMPEDLSEQISPLLNILSKLNIKIYKKDGFEADDIIGTIVSSHMDGIQKYMYSGDKDLMQLVDKNTFLYSPGNTFKPTKIYGTQDVLNRYGIQNNQFIDYLSLLGDTSDNIPGVKGVGAKTASKLIVKYSNLENIYNNIDDIDNPRLKKLLSENKENAFLSKRLITIDRNVEIKFKYNEMDINNFNYKAMVEELNVYEIRKFDKLLLKQKTNKSLNSRQYNIVDTKDKVEQLFIDLNKQEFVSIDLETTSIDANSAKIVGVSLCCKENIAYYIPFIFPEISTDFMSSRYLLNEIKNFIENATCKFIGQNIKYDALVLKNHGIEIKNIFFDTMIAESLIAPESNTYNLNSLSEKYLLHTMIDIDSLIGKSTLYDSMDQVPLKEIAEYACEDADIVYQIFKIQRDEIQKLNIKKIFYELEMPFIQVLIDIEYNGLFVDLKILSKLSKELNVDLDLITSKIYNHAGKEFNINSPKQLSVVLFDELNLKMFKKRSTSVEVLNKLIDYHPIAEDILKYRHLSKIINTYLDKLPLHVNAKTGRIHTSFNQAITSTGRLSSNKPNFQNIPIKTDVGKSIRKAFCTQFKDWFILSFDYSQIELRILAHYSNEKKLIDAFNNNLDIHTRTAALIYGINDEEVEYHHRRVAKMVNYSIAYGAGPFRISEELKISLKEAKMIIDNYFARYPGIKEYIENTVKIGTENGYVETYMGRRRNTINLNSTNKNIREAEKRATINMPIQGTASELIKIAMLEIRKYIIDNKLKTKMILQVHDELLFEVPKNEKDIIEDMVTSKMVDAIKFKVPIVVDSNFGSSWFEAH